MVFLPILLVIIVIASVYANYNKIAKQRLEDERKRMEMRRSAKKTFEEAQSASVKAVAPVSDRIAPQQSQRTAAPAGQTVRPRVSVKDMRSSVIMAEILNKPVSLRGK